MLTFDRFWQDKRDRVAVQIDTLIVAGWAGRDAHAIEHHIEELAAIGVPRPSTVPLFYRIGTGQLIANIDRSWDKRDDIRTAIEKHRAKLTSRAAQTNQLLLEQLRRQEQQRSATAAGDQPPLA